MFPDRRFILDLKLFRMGRIVRIGKKTLFFQCFAVKGESDCVKMRILRTFLMCFHEWDATLIYADIIHISIVGFLIFVIFNAFLLHI